MCYLSLHTDGVSMKIRQNLLVFMTVLLPFSAISAEEIGYGGRDGKSANVNLPAPEVKKIEVAAPLEPETQAPVEVGYDVKTRRDPHGRPVSDNPVQDRAGSAPRRLVTRTTSDSALRSDKPAPVVVTKAVAVPVNAGNATNGAVPANAAQTGSSNAAKTTNVLTGMEMRR